VVAEIYPHRLGPTAGAQGFLNRTIFERFVQGAPAGFFPIREFHGSNSCYRPPRATSVANGPLKQGAPDQLSTQTRARGRSVGSTRENEIVGPITLDRGAIEGRARRRRPDGPPLESDWLKDPFRGAFSISNPGGSARVIPRQDGHALRQHVRFKLTTPTNG